MTISRLTKTTNTVVGKSIMKKIVAGACAARLFRDDPVPDQEWSEYKPDDALKPKPKRRRRHRKMV